MTFIQMAILNEIYMNSNAKYVEKTYIKYMLWDMYNID